MTRPKNIDELTKVRNLVGTLRGLIEVSSAINSMMDYDRLLANIMEVAKRVMSAEASALMLLDEKTNELVILSAQGGGNAELVKEIRIPAGAGIAGAVVSTGRPVNVPDVTKDPRFFGDVDKKSGFITRAILAVPMMHQNRVIGVLEVLNPIQKPAFDDGDLEPFEAYAAMATTAIERARMSDKIRNQDRLDQELSIARQIQKSFLPMSSPCDGDCIQTRAFYEPAREVSGDFYDFLECDSEHLGVLIADVSGKGVPAALQMARATSQIRAIAPQCPSPSELLTKVNDFLCQYRFEGIFITLACVFFDRKNAKMKISSAGHYPPLLRRGRELLAYDYGDGPPLGILQGFPYQEKEVSLQQGDLLLFYTDGLIEARNMKKEEFGTARAEQIVRQTAGGVNEVVDALVRDVADFMKDAPRHDDLTLVAAQYR